MFNQYVNNIYSREDGNLLAKDRKSFQIDSYLRRKPFKVVIASGLTSYHSEQSS